MGFRRICGSAPQFRTGHTGEAKEHHGHGLSPPAQLAELVEKHTQLSHAPGKVRPCLVLRAKQRSLYLLYLRLKGGCQSSVPDSSRVTLPQLAPGVSSTPLPTPLLRG